MVGAGKLIECWFGPTAMSRWSWWSILQWCSTVMFGGMLATTWVADHQGRAVALRRLVRWRSWLLKHVNFDVSTLFSETIRVHPKGERRSMSPGGLVKDPISGDSPLGFALMFGTAGNAHVLMRFFTVTRRTERARGVFYATGFIGCFYILTFIIGFGAILL
ncbi:sodium:solute symporter family transporter [Pseudomonas aeruginosa]